MPLLQVKGSGAQGGGLGLSDVAVSTVLDSVFDTNSATTGGGGLDATGYSDSSLTVQGCRYAVMNERFLCIAVAMQHGQAMDWLSPFGLLPHCLT